MTIIKPNSTILFQGDSITDCGRKRDDINSLGNGYPLLIASIFPALFPEHGVKFINKGISGNHAADLVDRWQNDCLDLKPDVVSIMIGINDVWHYYTRNHYTSLEEYTNNYRTILKQTQDQLEAKLILMEPYVLHTSPDREQWREQLDPKRAAVRDLAEEFNAIFIPTDTIMQTAATKQDPTFWCPDGVHPAPAGHGLLATAWLKSVKAL